MTRRWMRRIVISQVGGRAGGALAAHLADHTATAIEETVRLRARSIAASVEVDRVLSRGLGPHELAERIVERRARLGAGGGAISALPGAVPGIGTGIELAASVADAVATIYGSVAMVLAVGAAYGADPHDVEARTLDVLCIIAIAQGLARLRGDGEIDVLGRKLGDGALSQAELTRLNAELGSEVVARVARRRALLLLGRELPFGVGVAYGATYNYLVLRRVGQAAIDYAERSAPGRRDSRFTLLRRLVATRS